MSYLQLALEESPRYEGAASTTPYRVSTDVFYLPVTAAKLTPDPQFLDRGDELRNIEGVVPSLLDGFEPKGSIAERCYLNTLIPLLRAAGWAGAHTAGDGTNEVVTLDDSGIVSGGTFKLTFGAVQTGAIEYNAAAADVQAALEALSTIGAGNVVCAGGPMVAAPVTVTFQGALGSQDVGDVTVDNTLITGGGTITVAVTTPGVAPTVLDPDGSAGAKVGLGAHKWVFTKAGGATPKTLQLIAAYSPASVFLKGQGYAVSQLTLDAAGQLGSDLVGLVLARITDPSLTPSLDVSAIPPIRRGDLKLTWITGSALSDSFTMQIANPVEVTKTLESAGYYPNLAENGDTPVLVTGSIPKRSLDAQDFDALIAATTFAATAKWDTAKRVGTSPTTYKLFVEMPACQYTGGDWDDLGNHRRFGANFDWRAGWDEASGYDCKITVVAGVSAVETYA